MSGPHRSIGADCPVCGESLHITRLECDSCGTAIEGHFLLSSLARLSGEQLTFLESFIRNKGVIKDMEVDLGISYPTVRARLDEMVKQLGLDGARKLRPSQEREERRSILDTLRAGSITADEAARRLARLSERGQ